MGDGEPSAAYSAPPGLDAGQQMRGTAFQIGNLPGTRSLSAKAQFAATAKLLRQAGKSGNVNEIQAALQSVSALQLPAGVSISTEVQDLAVELRQRISEDEELAHLDELRRSRGLKHEVRRLWDVMIAESARASVGGAGSTSDQHSQARAGEVSREGYREVHKRIAKVLVESGGFDAEQANSIADQDWADDVSRFSGTNHITVWLDEIRNKFKAAAAQSVALHGFKKLFARYDTDGSGELDTAEFFAAVRVDLGIGTDTMTDDELLALFRQVDVDGGGEVDANEFVQWLFHDMAPAPPVQEREGGSRVQKNSKASRRKRERAQRVATAKAAAATERLKRKFKEASSSMTEELGWDLIFELYDDDGSGELELDEFSTALRQECGLSESEVSDEEISELFGVIDADQSGAIDSKELKVLLTAELDTPTMTFGAFYASMFELVYLWSEQETEEQYILFMQGLFGWITVPTNGHVEGEDGLAELPVFDEPRQDPCVANFELRPLAETISMVAEDGSLLLPGFVSSILGGGGGDEDEDPDADDDGDDDDDGGGGDDADSGEQRSAGGQSAHADAGRWHDGSGTASLVVAAVVDEETGTLAGDAKSAAASVEAAATAAAVEEVIASATEAAIAAAAKARGQVSNDAANTSNGRSVREIQLRVSTADVEGRLRKNSTGVLARVAKKHAEAVAEIASVYKQRVADLEPVRDPHAKEREAAQSALRSELDEVQAPPAAALEAASAAELSVSTPPREEHKDAAAAQNEQMQAEHRDRLPSLENELESLRSEHSSAASPGEQHLMKEDGAGLNEEAGVWLGGIPRHCVTGEVGGPEATLDAAIMQQIRGVGEVLQTTVRVKDGANKCWCLITFSDSAAAAKFVERGCVAQAADAGSAYEADGREKPLDNGTEQGAGDSSAMMVADIEHFGDESFDTAPAQSDKEAAETRPPRISSIVLTPFLERNLAWSESSASSSVSNGRHSESSARRRSRNNTHVAAGLSPVEVKQRLLQLRARDTARETQRDTLRGSKSEPLCYADVAPRRMHQIQPAKERANTPWARRIPVAVTFANGKSNDVGIGVERDGDRERGTPEREITDGPGTDVLGICLEPTVTKPGSIPAVSANEDQDDGSSECAPATLNTLRVKHERKRRLGSGQQSARDGLVYVVPSRRRPRVSQRHRERQAERGRERPTPIARTVPDLGGDFAASDARSVRKAKFLTRSQCTAVEVNTWAEQQYGTVEAVLLRRRVVGVLN